uniref:Arginine-glutamic acid dipeptide repeats protein n=1 Tax=Bursaphelenchus xylophilus TaxID=6326 RepID=A0A1I7RUN7_BURXY
MASSAKIDLCRPSSGQPQNGCLSDLPSTSTGIRPVKPEIVKSEGSDDEKAPTLHRETDLNYDSDSPKKSPLTLKPDPDRPSSSSNYSDLHPEEYNNREWNIEKIQYNTSAAYNSVTSRLTDSLSSNLYDPKKQKTGWAYYTRDREEFRCFSDENRTFYRIGDYVYLEMDVSSPYVIGKIDSFKMRKTSSKNTLQVRCTKFFRRDELVPDAISLLDSERVDAGVVENNSDVKARELFPSESQVTAQVGCLRGLCNVLDKSVQYMLENGIEGKDTFFYCMSYTSETGRIAMFHPEIRIGKNHQAEIPNCLSTTTNKVKAHDKDREQLLFEPGRVSEETENLFVENVKNYRRTAAENCPKMNELEKKAFLGDRVRNDACEVLHRCNYDAREAIKKAMEEDKIYLENKTFMSSEDCKKFVKGLRNYGKNFHKIAKESFGTSFGRGELVHYYYCWKKGPEAFKPKNPTRNKSIYPQTKRTTRNGTATPTPSDLIDYDSLSEDEECDLHRACHHCYSSESRDWHHSGQDRQLLCTGCRHHFKKYGNMRHVENKPDRPPAALCREQTPTSNEDGEDGGVRTRSTRSNRHRTPCDDRAGRSVESEPERRSTPQRSVKVRKRSYHVSTGSGEDSHSNLNSPRKKEKEVKKTDKKEKDVADLPPILENEAKRDQELRETSSSRTSSYDGENGTPSKKRTDKSSPPPEPNARDSKEPEVPQEPKPEISENGDLDEDKFEWEPPVNEWKFKNMENCKLKRNVEITDQSQDSCARTQIILEIYAETNWQKRHKERAEARAQQQKQKAEEIKAQQAATSQAQNSLAGLASLANNAGGMNRPLGSMPNTTNGLHGKPNYPITFAAVLLLLCFLSLQAFIEARPPAAEPALEAVNIVKRQSDGDWDSPRGGGSYGGRGSDGDWDVQYYANQKPHDDGWWA